jgi:hypothetical protein
VVRRRLKFGISCALVSTSGASLSIFSITGELHREIVRRPTAADSQSTPKTLDCNDYFVLLSPTTVPIPNST